MTTNRCLKLAAGALAAGSTAANASVVVFDFPDYTVPYGGTQWKNFGDLDLVNGTFSNTQSGIHFGLGASGNGGINFFSYSVYAAWGSYSGNNGMLKVFGGNSLVSADSYFTYEISRSGNVPVPSGNFYLGLQLHDGGQLYYGWFEISAQNAPGSYDLTFKRFAFENTPGLGILTPGAAVPEASTLGFAGGLFGLVVAAHLRRRKQKQAAASDKFLALAAGESVRD